jgi:cell division protein FtsB
VSERQGGCALKETGREPKKKTKKRYVFRIALLCFAVYVGVTLVQLQLELDERQKVSEDYAQQIAEQQRQKEELENKNEDYEKYLEERAREQGYARPGEIIFQEIPGVE